MAEIASEVSARIGETPASSVRSYLRLNTPRLFTKIDRGLYRVQEDAQRCWRFRMAGCRILEREAWEAAGGSMPPSYNAR